MACPSLAAAKSGTKGKLRPLQTGTTLRRLVAHDNENLRQTEGQAQFAIAERAGHRTHGAHDASPNGGKGDLAWLQLDCTNAFGEISWEKCLQALHNKMPHLLAFEAQCLAQPTRAISMEFMMTAGLDQGDPFSPVAFAATLPLGELQNAIFQERLVTEFFSYLDDRTLTVPHDAAEATRQLAREKLAALGVRLNMTKWMIYTPSQVAPPAWRAGGNKQSDTESMDAGIQGVGTVFPAGENHFLEDFAESVKNKTVTTLDPLKQLTTRAQSGRAGEASGEHLTAPLRNGEGGTPPANAATAYHWRPDQHGRQTRAPQLRAHKQHQCRGAGKQQPNPATPISQGGMGLKRLNWMREGAHVASWLQCARRAEELIVAAVPQTRNWKEAALQCQQAVKLAHANMVENEGVDAMKEAGSNWETLHLACRTKLQKAIALKIMARCRDRWFVQASERQQQVSLSGSTRNQRSGAGAWVNAATASEKTHDAGPTL